MSLEQKIDELNTNIQGLIKILEVYPSPLDEATDKAENKPVAEKKTKAPAKPKQEEKVEEAADTEAVEPEHSIDDLAKLAKEVIQANKANGKEIKGKMDALEIEKVSLTPPEHVDAMYKFMEGLK